MKKESWSAIVNFMEWEPGNATRYSIIVTPINGDIANRSSGFSTYSGFLVSWVNAQGIPSMLVPSYTKPNAQYVSEKMGISMTDAEEISKLLNDIISI